MQTAEAAALLAKGLRVNDQAEALDSLATRLGEWQLLLKLANGHLHRLAQSSILTAALNQVPQALDHRGLISFDAHNPVDRQQAASATMEVSLDMLRPNERAWLAELVIFPENSLIPWPRWRSSGGIPAA